MFAIPRRILIGGIVFFVIVSSVFSQWEKTGSLSIPKAYYTFMDITPDGNLVVVTHNCSDINMAGSFEEMPVYLIKNLVSDNPSVSIICKIKFDTQRGYGGIACDIKGNIYITGDTGNQQTSFIKKFKSDGSPDTSFGINGEVLPNRRCLGLDVVGDYVFMAVDWGEILLLNAASGKIMGSTPTAPKGYEYVRDIVVDSTTMSINGIVESGIVIWEGGYPWNISQYKCRTLLQKSGTKKSAEGISLDPITHTLQIVPSYGDSLLFVDKTGKVEKLPVKTSGSNLRLSDSAVSPDGSILLVSDLKEQTIHIFRRDLTKYLSGAGTSASTESPLPSKETATRKETVTPKETTAPPKETSASQKSGNQKMIGNLLWYLSLTEGESAAQKENKPMILYLRKGAVKKCVDFEINVLLSKEFTQRAGRYICIFEDTGISNSLMSRFNVKTVPHILILNSQGSTIASFAENISATALYAVLDSESK